MITVCFFVALLTSYKVLCLVPSDEIKFLPGVYVTPTFKQYSGYLTVFHDMQFYYWFVQSQGNASADPVVLWLSGKPGCSSLVDLFAGNGPFRVMPDLRLEPNDFSWNKIANVLYLESPAGTGYSDATNSSIEENDDSTAQRNYWALLDFFKKYPKFQSNEFYVAGEDYAGVYVPTLSEYLMNDSSINFKGIIIGNGVCHETLQADSLLYYQRYHGIIGERLWKEAISSCCPNKTTEICYFSLSTNAACIKLIHKMRNESVGLEHYNLYKPKFDGVHKKLETNQYDDTQEENKLPTSDYMLEKEASNHLTYSFINKLALTKYMNLPLLRENIGVKNYSKKWSLCNQNLTKNYRRQYKNMADFYKKIINTQKYRVWFYNGDFSMVNNYLGQDWFLYLLKYKEESDYEKWVYIGEFNKIQFGGFYIKYFPNVTFATIYAAGFLTTIDKPLQSFLVFKAFLQNSHL